MVEIEHCDEGDAAGAPRGGTMDPRRPDPTRAVVKAQEEQDSFSKRRSYLLRKMRFSKQEVDLAVSELGERASLDRLVDWILTAQEATFELKIEHCDEGDASRGGAMDLWQPDPMRATVKVEEAYAGLLLGVMDKRLSLLQMGFTKEEVSSAIATSGREATIEDLADMIFAGRFSNTTEQKRMIFLKGRQALVQTSMLTLQGLPSSSTQVLLTSATTRGIGYRDSCSASSLLTETRHVVVSRSSMTTTDVLGPLQPHRLERTLGYPVNHTDLPGINLQDRVASMKFALQTDTVAFLLSVLKDRYPDGLRLLSIYSGVGGAEVALHRLGIPLRFVVSVEGSAVNRRMLKRWWGETEQDGELIQLPSTHKLNPRVLEEMMNECGGFDLVIGGNYSPYQGGGTKTMSAKMGIDSTRLFEYVRLVESVRSHARS